MRIRYRRGPKVTVYEQELLHDDGRLIVTRAPFRPSASLLAQVPGLEDREYRAIWFVIAGEWHDLGKVYTPDGKLAGYYCDIIRPPRRTADGLEIEDLFLDLWIFPAGRHIVLDEEEFEEALEQGWLTEELAARAKGELDGLIEQLNQGLFPPAFVEGFRWAWRPN